MFQELIHVYGIFQLLGLTGQSHLRLGKGRQATCTDGVFSCHVVVGDASGRIRVYTTKDMWSNGSQTTSASILSIRITVRLGGRLHLYLALSTCDLIAQDAF